VTYAIAALVITTVAVAIAAAQLALLLAGAHRRADRLEAELGERDAGGYERLVGLMVTVSLTDATIVRGILRAVYRDAIVLAGPEALNAGRPANVGSEMTIERVRVGAVVRHQAGDDE
jgi:hypothetical protein